MECPECDHKFKPNEVGKISRWTSLECPACHSRWNRKLDLQFMLVLILGLASLISFSFLGIYLQFRLPLFFTVLGTTVIVGWRMMIQIDAATIKLYPAEKRSGWKRIIGDKVL